MDNLNVSTPQVFSRLAIVDPNAPTSVQMPKEMRRDDSFFVGDRERPTSMDAFNRHFPSSRWLRYQFGSCMTLCSDENMDLSPSATANTLLMARPGFCSTTSLNIESTIGTPAGLNPFASFDSPKVWNELWINYLLGRLSR